MKKQFTIRHVALIGVMAAVVTVASFISINIPTAIGSTRIHFGNIACLLSGFILGPIGGGLSAGLGSALFDLFHPQYSSEALITFFMKFVIGFLCGKIAWSGEKKALNIKFNIIAGITASLAYVALYMSKTFIQNYFVLKNILETSLITTGQKGLVSLVNAIIAVTFAVPLAKALKEAMRAAKIDI